MTGYDSTGQIFIDNYPCFNIRFIIITVWRNSLSKCQKINNISVKHSIKFIQLEFLMKFLILCKENEVESQPIITWYCNIFLLVVYPKYLYCIYISITVFTIFCFDFCFCHTFFWTTFEQHHNISSWLVRCNYQLCDCRKTAVIRKLHRQSSLHVIHHY